MKGRLARLKDVAERAGVAVNTASAILNRRPNSWASPATEERVFRAAEELGYRPNHAARALRLSRFHAIGLAIEDLGNSCHTTFAGILEAEIARHGYHLVIANRRADPQRESRVLDELVHRGVDGVAAFLSDVDGHLPYLSARAAAGNPLVVLGVRGEVRLPVDAVLARYDTGVREALGALTVLGHRRIAVLDGRSGGFASLAGGIAEQAGRVPEEIRVVECGPSPAAAAGALRTALAMTRDRRPTAILASSMSRALGAMCAARDVGLDVPRDLSVIGAGDIPLAADLPVPLATVTPPLELMARQTATLLLGRIETGLCGEPEQHLVATRYIARGSVAPAR